MLLSKDLQEFTECFHSSTANHPRPSSRVLSSLAFPRNLAATLLILGLALAPSAFACKCAPPLPQASTCQGAAVLTDTNGFIGEVLTAESMDDWLQQILRNLPPAAAIRARILMLWPPESELTPAESVELSQLLALALPPAQQQLFQRASPSEKEQLIEQLSSRPLHFRLRVIESHDARFHGEIEVLTDVSSCGLPLRKGELWHLLPDLDEAGRIHVSLCGGHRQLLFPSSERTHRTAVQQGSQASRLEGIVSQHKSGQPLPNLLVQARGSSETWSASTDSRGAFEFPLLPPGPYELVLTSQGQPLLREVLHLCPQSRHRHHSFINSLPRP